MAKGRVTSSVNDVGQLSRGCAQWFLPVEFVEARRARWAAPPGAGGAKRNGTSEW
jgi:hypothetical protein